MACARNRMCTQSAYPYWQFDSKLYLLWQLYSNIRQDGLKPMLGATKSIFKAQYFVFWLRPDGLKLTGCCDTKWSPMRKPLAHNVLVRFPILGVAGEHPQQLCGIPQVVFVVVLG